MVPTVLDLGAIFTTAGAEITNNIAEVMPVALPIGATIIGIGVAVRLFRKFVKG